MIIPVMKNGSKVWSLRASDKAALRLLIGKCSRAANKIVRPLVVTGDGSTDLNGATVSYLF